MSKSNAGVPGHLILLAGQSATTIRTAAGGNMLEDTARYDDRIYAFKNYATVAKTLANIVATEPGGAQGRLLDVACGTARHLELLRSSFDVEGLEQAEVRVRYDAVGLTGRGLYVTRKSPES